MAKTPRISQAELEIMKLIWTAGEGVTCQRLLERLPNGRGWKTTTVLTFLSRLCEKGLLAAHREGKANVYVPLLTEEQYRRAETMDFLRDIHGGSVRSLLAALVDSPGLTPEELDELKEWFEHK